jgi:hypothetical protein
MKFAATAAWIASLCAVSAAGGMRKVVRQAEDLAEPLISHHKCSDAYSSLPASCRPKSCNRVVLDGLISASEARLLRTMANSALAAALPADMDPAWVTGQAPPPAVLDGPAIVDVNTGFTRHSALGLRPLYRKSLASRFQLDPSARDLYRAVGEKLHKLLLAAFSIEDLYFTAPTFIARLQGSAGWEPRDIHDEYWHAHADKVRVRFDQWQDALLGVAQNNTEHYDYSALLYLADHGEDFVGGEFEFLDQDGHVVTTVEPKVGRVVLFSSGPENPHRVNQVREGVRFAMSLWFTCSRDRMMPSFLDGKQHGTFAAQSPGGDEL